MGLLDSVLSAAAGSMMGGNQQQQPQAGGLGGLGGLLGGLGGLGALLPVIVGMLGNDSQHGGLGGLLEKFNQAGLGDTAKSWVGAGQNAPISGDQLGQVLGGDMMGRHCRQAGPEPWRRSGPVGQCVAGPDRQTHPARPGARRWPGQLG